MDGFGHPKQSRLFCNGRAGWRMAPRRLSAERTVLVSRETAAGYNKRGSVENWLAAALLFGFLCANVPAMQSQSSDTQPPSGQGQPSQNQPSQSQPSQNANIPDAPSVQPSAAAPEPPPIPKPEEKKQVERDPWTNQPINKPAPAQPGTEPASAPPPMPPVKTLPPGTAPKPSAQEQLYTFVIHSSFVQVPVTVKDHDGRTVDGLLSTDFTVKENGTVQKLSFFTSDPFALSVAIVLDLGMPDATVQKVNQTFPALVGSFAPYDEVALYTYSSTVSEVSDFAAPTQKLATLLDRMKTEPGQPNGVPVLSGPLAPNGPIINGVPVGSPTEPVYTPEKEAHVLNDAILRAALDLSKRERTRRKIIFVISDGRESGSNAAYRDVIKVLQTHEIEVKAVAVGNSALPIYDKIERLHLPGQGYDNLLPKYTRATGGGEPYAELSRSAIQDIYAQAMSEARNQYTLGYTPTRPKTPTASACRDIEVLVSRPNLNVYAKPTYCPVVAAR
jgi:VWFA-related protein